MRKSKLSCYAKYHNRKTVIDGIRFDSQREGERYRELKLLKTAGVVLDFELQPEYVLLEGFTKNGTRYHPIKYRADFRVRYPDGRVEIEDVKGMQTREFIIKRKLFEHRYPDLALKLL